MERYSTIKPRIAVIGSCVSRDVFNSEILGENYKDKVEVVSTVFQTALPSLARELPVDFAPPIHDIKASHIGYIEQEYSGRSAQDLVDAKPDIILVDFLADIHFGTVRFGDEVVTKNTVAFNSFELADTYYETATGSDIFRQNGDTYSRVAIESMEYLIAKMKAHRLNPEIIVNSGRYSTQYITSDGGITEYDRNIDKLKIKNRLWDELDAKMVDTLGCGQITYPDDLIIGDEAHKWGLHPLHLDRAYYKYLWESVQILIKK